MAAPITPRRIYCKRNICVVCGFSFIQNEVASDGTVREVKHLKQKLRLNDEKCQKIKEVLPDFILSTDKDANNGICIKCSNTVEKILKIRSEEKSLTEKLRKSREQVEKLQLVLPSPRKDKLALLTTKRLLRSPSSYQEPKQSCLSNTFPTNFKVSISDKVTLHGFDSLVSFASTPVAIAPKPANFSSKIEGKKIELYIFWQNM